jgi:serine protease SohB
MIEALINLFTFSIETIVIVLAILIITAGLVAILTKGKSKLVGKLRVKKLNDHYEEMTETLNDAILSKAERKELNKSSKKTKKSKKKTKKKAKSQKRMFVVDFKGDMKASAASQLREEVSAIISVAKSTDEVLVRLESPGGIVFGYGLASSQLQRLKDANIPLTISVDKLAASGGYMMACVADKIIAAPFAVIGSIGVVAQLPNFYRWMQKREIDFDQITAGDYKRTMTMLAPNTKADREKMQEEVDETHDLFKDFVKEHRPELNMKKVATGEHWFAIKAKELGLVDELQTSDDYLLKASANTNIVLICFPTKKKMAAKFSESAHAAIDKYFSTRRKNKKDFIA